MNVLLRPLITEKAASMNEESKFAFIVDRKADKLQIKEAVEDMYGVTVESINTINTKGKPKSRYTKSSIVTGRTKKLKKAIVTLKDGDFIDFYSEI